MRALTTSKILSFGLLLLHSGLSAPVVLAQTAAPPGKNTAPVATENNDATEEVDVNKVKQKYWARGEETEMSVVQNRLYSKAKKFSFGISGGPIFSDPFMDIKSYTLGLGYNFSEYFGLDLVYMKYLVNPSSALTLFQKTLQATANTNIPDSYMGAEAKGNFLYGKLSLIGQAIIYYDFYFAAGYGVTKTETGNNGTYSVGAGQRFFLNKFMSIKIDYRCYIYREVILEKQIVTKIGLPVDERTNYNHSFSGGVDFLIGVF